jgi:hypothetical protein
MKIHFFAAVEAAVFLIGMARTGVAQTLPPSVQVRVTLTSPVYHIQIHPRTFAPYMPKNVIAKAEIVGLPAGTVPPTEFTWRVMLDWNNPAFPTHHSLGNRTFQHTSPFKVDFGNEIRGGTLKVFAKTLIEGQEVSGVAIAQVVGSNPPRRAVYKLLPSNRTGLLLSKIAVVESGVKQFTEPDGLPKESITHDFGLMQLNAKWGAVTSADQIWDWRENVRRGIEMFTGKRRTSIVASRSIAGRRVDEDLPASAATTLGVLNIARSLLDLPQLAPPTLPMLSETPGSGIEAGENDRDKLNLTQLERDAVRRYNGGREYAYVLTPDWNTLEVTAAGWQVDPTRGGISPRSGDLHYVTKVIQADSGFVIPPPKPVVKAKTASRSRRTKKR